MFLLDTNVLSELRRPERANRRVAAWAAMVPTSSLFISAITILEIDVGILMQDRRDPAHAARLQFWLQHQVIQGFSGRILAVDVMVARRCAGLQATQRLVRNDLVIAATALVHGLTIVTRNIRDFAATGATLLNPWSPEEPALPTETALTIEQVMRAQGALRAALGLGAERFPLPAFIGMISDEIEQMRAAGRSDREVIDIVESTTGQRISPEDLARFYAPPESRHQP